MKQFEKYLLVIMVSIAIAGIIGLFPEVISVLLLVYAIIYLFTGWRFFSLDFSTGFGYSSTK